MPLFALAALLCPAKVEGTIFALFTATMNFGSLFGSESGVRSAALAMIAPPCIKTLACNVV